MSKGMRISVSAAAVWIALVVAGSYWRRHAKVRASTKGRQGNSAFDASLCESLCVLCV